jgi:hypothetical protein
MARRVTTKEIEAVFGLVCREMGWSREVLRPATAGGHDWIVGSVLIDNNPTYGGRQVEMVTSDTGSTRALTPYRLKPAEFEIWCRGVLLAKEYSRGKDNSRAA